MLKFIDTLGPSVHLSPQPNLLTVALARIQLKMGTHVKRVPFPIERLLRAEPALPVYPRALTSPAKGRLDCTEGIEIRIGNIGEPLHN